MSKIPTVKINSVNDLFGGADNFATEVTDIALEKCHDFKNHPFKVLQNEDFDDLVDSIRINGVIEPILVRPMGDDYEIVSGHRRCAASRFLQLDTIPAVIKELSDDEAIVTMVDANLRRENLSYSEKAFAYKMRFDALKHQGKASDKDSLESLSEGGSEKPKTIQRLIRLTHLLPRILELVDNGNIPFFAGVDLSYLTPGEQALFYTELANKTPMKVDVKAAAMLKKLHNDGAFNQEEVHRVLFPSPVKKKNKSFNFKSDKIYQYFPEETEDEEIEQLIYRLLDKWKSEH